MTRGADALGMAGGDGSQAVVAAVAAEHGLPFVCIPAGTRNHLALDLGIDRDDPVGALDAFGSARESTIDLAEVNGEVFVNNVSLGLYAQVVASAEYRWAKRRTVAEMLPDLVGPDAASFGLSVDGPDGPVTSAQLIQISNNPYTLSSLAGFGSRPVWIWECSGWQRSRSAERARRQPTGGPGGRRPSRALRGLAPVDGRTIWRFTDHRRWPRRWMASRGRGSLRFDSRSGRTRFGSASHLDNREPHRPFARPRGCVDSGRAGPCGARQTSGIVARQTGSPYS